jgi:anti-sigma regulatory factor (Ser/Thr protein kinase)
MEKIPRMPKRKGRRSPIEDAIERFLDAKGTVASGEVASAANVSRQAAQYQLRKLVERGDLVAEGAGRSAHYRRLAQFARRYELAGLSESDVWTEEYAALRAHDFEIFDNPKIKSILNFAFTEMLNNAIDHSFGTEVDVRWFVDAAIIAFEIADDGVGVFRNMARDRGLSNEYDAIGEISKGRQTTAPTQHSGLGIYFTSRMVSRFVLTSGQWSWIADNRIGDHAVRWLEGERAGTLVRCEVDASTEVDTGDVFRSVAPAEIGAGSRSTVRVRLFEQDGFVSRTEAKRLAAELEQFGLVEIDFSGVDQVGQGFIDELFRVWQNEHPSTRLVPVNTTPVVDALLRLTRRS